MTRIVLDDPVLEKLTEKLRTVSDDAVVCDSSGRLLGYFTPAVSDDGYIHSEPEITKEEFDRRMKEPTYTTAEVLECLKNLK